jgi:hypothetical protein
LNQTTSPKIKEDLLYYVWSLKTFDLDDLKTTSGQPVQIIQAGIRNQHSGPDFLHARIRIGTETWVGHVEMHVMSSDWMKHQHQDDKAFQNVILHVVYQEDEKISLPNGEELACIELKDRIRPILIGQYENLMLAENWIPCEKNERPVTMPALRGWYESILVERLAAKTDRIQEVLENTDYDWEEAFYRTLGRNFGFNVNADVFEALTISLPRKILIKHKDKLKQVEALLYGQAGMLRQSFQDDYARDLKAEYDYLQMIHKLTPLQEQQWKYMRMRPANFPTIRIAQFAVLIFKTVHLFSKMLAARSVKEIVNMFQSDVSGYWKNHYIFDQESERKSKKLGESSIHLIIINTVIPFLFHYGQTQRMEALQDRALRFLEELPAESNQIIRRFKSLDFEAKTAFDSQALIQLKNYYCDRKRCLECTVGNSILRS